MALFYRGLPEPLDIESRLVAGAFLVDVEVRRNVGEHAAERVLQGTEARDDAHADDGGDQAVLDRGGAGLVVDKAGENGLHTRTLQKTERLLIQLRRPRQNCHPGVDKTNMHRALLRPI